MTNQTSPAAPTDDASSRSSAQVDGWVHPRFEPVREAFASNLRVGEDLGAAVAVYRWGDCVVDLWGGRNTDGSDYRRDTLQMGFSSTKGLVAMCLAALIQDKEVDPNRAVAAYWPEFEAQGKGTITVAQVASHQAGLPAFPEGTTLEDLTDWERSTGLLAASPPAWLPGTAHGYHALTVGHLLGEVIRRATGDTVGTVLQQRFGAHLAGEGWIGTPETRLGHVDQQIEVEPPNSLPTLPVPPLASLAFNNPPITAAVLSTPRSLLAEIPAANGVFTARALARIYAATVRGPLRVIDQDTVDLVRSELAGGGDLILTDQPTHFGMGFLVSCPRAPMLGPNSFGHDGRGGSLGFADPETGISFGFVCNRLATEPAPDRRTTRLIAAVRQAL